MMKQRRIAAEIKRWGLPLLVIVAFAVGLGGESILAHGGEDHGGEDHGGGDTKAPATPTPTSTDGSAGGSIAIAKEQQFAVGLRTESTESRDITATVEVTGRVVPRTDGVADVVPPFGGRINGGSRPSLGGHVRRGEVLFRVAQLLTPSERTTLRTEQIKTRTELNAAEREVARLESLSGVVAGKRLVEARISRDGARDALRAVSAQLKGEGASVAVTAPISGVIVEADLAGGEVVESGKVVYRIADLSRVWIEADLFERDLKNVSVGDKAEIVTPAFPGRVFSGRMEQLGGSVDPNSRTIKGLFVVENRDESLRLNMSATLIVAQGERRTSLAVRSDAIVRSGIRTVVFVHTTPEAFEVRDIVLGDGSSGEYREVLRGLKEGDRVLITGASGLKSLAGL